MGLYAIDCVSCNKPFMWFSGSLDQRCETCVKESEMKHLSEKEKEILDLAGTNSCRIDVNHFAIYQVVDLLTTINSLREDLKTVTHQRDRAIKDFEELTQGRV